MVSRITSLVVLSLLAAMPLACAGTRASGPVAAPVEDMAPAFVHETIELTVMLPVSWGITAERSTELPPASAVGTVWMAQQEMELPGELGVGVAVTIAPERENFDDAEVLADRTVVIAPAGVEARDLTYRFDEWPSGAMHRQLEFEWEGRFVTVGVAHNDLQEATAAQILDAVTVGESSRQ
ncbi:MAG: hypothetical protein AAF799_16330 [Myxococcota bacterium]